MWAHLEEKLGHLKDRPPTSRMEAMYEEARKSLEEVTRRLPYPAGACGVAVAIDGRLVCADVFDAPSTLERLWNRLVISYALDARATARPAPSAGPAGTAATAAVPTPEQVSRFLSLPAGTPVEYFASPGIGQSLRFRTPERIGSALTHEDVVVHLEMFPSEGQSRQAYGHTRMARPSQRGPRV